MALVYIPNTATCPVRASDSVQKRMLVQFGKAGGDYATRIEAVDAEPAIKWLVIGFTRQSSLLLLSPVFLFYGASAPSHQMSALIVLPAQRLRSG
jgi:hypothetical protein